MTWELARRHFATVSEVHACASELSIAATKLVRVAACYLPTVVVLVYLLGYHTCSCVDGCFGTPPGSSSLLQLFWSISGPRWEVFEMHGYCTRNGINALFRAGCSFRFIFNPTLGISGATT